MFVATMTTASATNPNQTALTGPFQLLVRKAVTLLSQNEQPAMFEPQLHRSQGKALYNLSRSGLIAAMGLDLSASAFDLVISSLSRPAPKQ